MGSETVKLVGLQPSRPRPSLFYCGSRPSGALAGLTVEPGHDQWTASLPSLLQETGWRRLTVATALPDQPLMLRRLQLPQLPPREVDKVMEVQAEYYFGMPTDELAYDYQVEQKLAEQTEVLLVGTPQEPVNQLVELLAANGFSVERVDIEPHCACRAVIPQELIEANVSYAIVDIGAVGSNLSIFIGSRLQMVRTIDLAGHDFTQAISQKLQVDRQQAEYLKRQHGINGDQKVEQALRPLLHGLLQQLLMTLEYFQVDHRQSALAYIYLLGGSSQLPGLLQLLASEVGMLYARLQLPVPKMVRGEATRHIAVDADVAKEPLGPAWAIAVGLALGGLIDATY